ncbi:hypothetical protein [Pararhizobium qamdonense]|uniref:hypothetical protein n=1 Tax=Pararhizobium qamdonense TaxID=3031126 RepID=UPI0023E0B91E|nr:hypothetical protein [Pararhizobium qamdonense]
MSAPCIQSVYRGDQRDQTHVFELYKSPEGYHVDIVRLPELSLVQRIGLEVQDEADAYKEQWRLQKEWVDTALYADNPNFGRF